MPAITAASAKLAYDKAANSLKRACNSLERYLPPSQDAAEEIQLAPPLAPRRRVDSVAGCALCVSELLDLEPGDRNNHQCTHQNQPLPQDVQRDVDTSLYISSSKMQGNTSDHYLNCVVFLMEWSDILPD